MRINLKQQHIMKVEEDKKTPPAEQVDAPVDTVPTEVPPAEEAIEEDIGDPPPLSGRDAFIQRYRGAFPDLGDDDIDDDKLFEYAGQGWSEREELQGRFDQINGSNERLAQTISEDPRFAQFISMIGNGENLMYALGKTFGNIIDQLDDAGLEQLRSGQQEYSGRVKQMRENFQKYENTLKGYAEEHGLSEENVADVNNTILDIAEALNAGEITYEIIDNIWKGMDYDDEKTAREEAAKLAGKNEAIQQIKNKKSDKSPLPDLKGKATQPSPRPSFTSQRSPTLSESVKDRD